MIINHMLEIAQSGIIIPKPKSRSHSIIKGVGIRRKEKALIYLIPNHNNPDRPYQKGITFSEFEKAYEILSVTGEFTHKWFNENLFACSKEGSCNFTTIGGIFELLKVAKYSCRGKYIRI